MSEAFFESWMEEVRPNEAVDSFVIMNEKHGARAAAQVAVRQAARDHLAGLELIDRMGGFPKASAFIKNKVSLRPKVMSGDLGEILASEYVSQRTDYTVPIKRLRWKDDRDVTMRGNDVIASRLAAGSARLQILKVEAKSRKSLSDSAVDEALKGLAKHSDRPNPSSLAFISARLREQGRDQEASQYEAIQESPLSLHEVEHMVFTFSGNDAQQFLAPHIAPQGTIPNRRLVGCVVPDHQTFIRQTFTDLNAADT